MITLKEIDRIASKIRATEKSGSEINESLFSALDKILTQRMLDGISSRDSKLRRAAIAISSKYQALDEKHKRRLLNSMSSVSL